MRTVRWIAGTAAIIAIVAIVSGHAAGMSDGSKKLAANKVSVTRCDTDGVTITNNLTSSNIVSVTVAGIASACANQAIKVTVNNGTANSSASGTVPAGGGSMTLTLAGSVPIVDVVQTDLTITG